jgi:Tol biopolymer transport system component
MGEVYRARDTTLDRDVAIKVLPEAFAHDAERLARFLREARTLASLNHPNIAAIYGLEDADGTKALVMELVEGDDLSQRIARGAIPIDEALPVATQIAEALEAAHEQGIIHRDLKPANIKVRTDGTVKVLDFGLAKAMEPAAGSSPSMSMAPTITTPAMMTGVGMILGTAAYMSPEQAKGRTVDRRADVWAFGAVLYEMLTGQRAFGGDDVSEVLSRVLQREPEWAALPSGLSSTLVVYLKRCLHKDLKQRIGDMHDVRLALEGAFETAPPQTTAAATPAASRGRLVWMAALVVAALGMVAMAVPALRHLRETPPPETRLEISTPATDQAAQFALSPDGRQIVFVAAGDGASRLWLRSLGATTAQPLAGTDGPTWPFWSPDGRSVGFFADGALKRLDFGGGAPQTLAPAVNGRGGTWNAEGVIVFAPSATTPLLRVSATGGTVSAVTTLDPQQSGHVTPFFLPDGRRVLFAAFGGPDAQGIYLGSLDGGAPTRLAPDISQAVYLPAGPGNASGGGGWLFWGRASTLVAQRLDLDRQTLAGDPVTLADGMASIVGALTGGWSVAPGLVAYRTGAGGQQQLTWVDSSGTARGTVGDPDGSLVRPRVSPDGRRVVVNRTVQGNTDLWLLDGARTSRLTFDAAGDDWPVWSPDGTRIVFRSRRTGAGDLYQTLTNGAGGEERLVAGDQSMAPSSWSPDGRFLLYQSIDPQTDSDFWVVPMEGDPTPSVFLKTPFREVYGAFSPDGRWVAYHSNESGRTEIYVRPFVPPVSPNSATGTPAAAAGGQRQVSTAGGIMAVWRPDGNALYYLNPAGAMMAAPITVVGDGLEPGAPVVLFPTRIVGGGVDNQTGRQYDVAPDGRFLINTELDAAGTAAPITLIQHWNPGN